MDAYNQAVSGLNDQTMAIFDPAMGRKQGKGSDDGTKELYTASELSLSISDEDIIKECLSREAAYRSYLAEHDIEGRSKRNYKAWRGGKKTKDNKIFEATETFIPLAIKSTPEPVVTDGNSQTDATTKISDVLLATAKRNHPPMRSVLRGMTRHWMINFIGFAKLTYSPATLAKQATVVHPDDLALDPAATCYAGHYDGKWIREKRYDTIASLIERFPGKATEIKKKAGESGKFLQSIVVYKEWWTEDSLIFTYEDLVLSKTANPHAEKGYFSYGKIPYVSLTVFNQMAIPHDSTGLIEQTIALQDTVDKRIVQIDDNADKMNNAHLINGKYVPKENAPEITTALKKGIAVYIAGAHENVQNAVSHINIPALPPIIMDNLQDSRSELRNVFGITGSTAEGVNSQDTVRGKVLASQADSSRIGGGITTEIELAAAAIYEWWLHFMVVYEGLQIPDGCFVEVKEGSLTPKDPLTKRNEAMDLWNANAIDPVTLMKRLDSANPEEDAMAMFLWQQIQKGAVDPTFLFPNWAQVQAKMQQMQQAQAQPGQVPGQAEPQGGPDMQAPQEGNTDGYAVPPEEQQSKQLLQSVKI